MKRHVNIDPKEAKKILKENRVFADYFVTNYSIDHEITELRIVFEEKLKDDLIDKELEKIAVNDEVLLSFYKDNKEEFYKDKEIEFKVYNFKTFEAAYRFYQDCSKDIARCTELIAESNISVVDKTLPFHNFNPQLRNLLQDDIRSGYIVPPQKFYKNYIVLEVENITDKGILPYDKINHTVKKDLQKRIRHDIKTKLSKKLLSVSE